MGRPDFGQQWQHFYGARRALMAPHGEGEAKAFAYALEACNSARSTLFDDEGVIEEESAESWGRAFEPRRGHWRWKNDRSMASRRAAVVFVPGGMQPCLGYAVQRPVHW